MQLYSYFRSSAAYRVRIALNLKGVPYDTVPIHLQKEGGINRKPEFRTINPHMRLPALRLDSGDVLIQSLAIIGYLDDIHPQPPLLPRDPIAKARVRAIAEVIACDIHPLNNLRVLNYLRGAYGQDDAGVNAWYRHWITEGFNGLEAQARQHSAEGRFCHGDAVSLADVLLAPQMFNARRFETDLTAFPTLTAISAHLESLPAFAAARPEVQPDAK